MTRRPSKERTSAAQQREFAYKLGEMARAWRGQVEAELKPLGLSFVQWSTLTQISMSDDDLVQKDLALRVGIDGPTMVGVLDRLVKSSLVERRVSPRDRRANTVHLRTAGHKILQTSERELRKVRDRLLKGFTSAELAEGIALFERISSRARSW